MSDLVTGPDYTEGDPVLLTLNPPFQSLLTSPPTNISPTTVTLEVCVDGGTPVIFTWAGAVGVADPARHRELAVTAAQAVRASSLSRSSGEWRPAQTIAWGAKFEATGALD